MEMNGRVAIVTGGARGIGYAVAERLSKAGAQVAIADVSEEGVEEAAERLRSAEGKVIGVRADVRRPEGVSAMVEQVLDALGSLDVIVNNAGMLGRAAPMWELTDDDWFSVLDLDLTAVFYCCRAVIGHMRDQKHGAIVNVSSIAGKEGNPTMIPYSVAKAGVICLTKALAKEVAADGVRVNSVAPGLIETPLLSQIPPETIEANTARMPIGRLGKPEEVAAIVHFLASDDASLVTGQCYDASGGRATY